MCSPVSSPASPAPRAWRRLPVAALPAAVGATATAVLSTIWHDRAPHDRAAHVSTGGAVDGFASPGTVLGVSLGLVLGLGVLFSVLTGFSRRSPSGQRRTTVLDGVTTVLTRLPFVALLLADLLLVFCAVRATADEHGLSVGFGARACRVRALRGFGGASC